MGNQPWITVKNHNGYEIQILRETSNEFYYRITPSLPVRYTRFLTVEDAVEAINIYGVASPRN